MGEKCWEAILAADWIFSILSRANLIGEQFWVTPAGQHVVYLTPAHQLIGPYSAFPSFRKAFPVYQRKKGMTASDPTWEAHHIIEKQDLAILRDLGKNIPADNLCPAVLLPHDAHRGRINRTLPRGGSRPVVDLDAYRQAYSILGDYTGFGEVKIRRELMAICRLIIEG
jgi:hypothetical protein